MTDHIPAEFAQIEWEDSRKGMLEILIFDRRCAPDEDARDDLMSSSAGACTADWLDGSDARSTPEGVFCGMIQAGFLNDDVLLQALEEFGKIDCCEWARTMGSALAANLRARRP